MSVKKISERAVLVFIELNVNTQQIVCHVMLNVVDRKEKYIKKYQVTLQITFHK